MKETKFKQTDIGLIPEDWNVVSLSSVIDECNYGVGAEAVKFNGKIKYLRITDIDDENHRYVPRPLASPSFYSEMYLAKVGDLFVARTGASVGKSYLYNENDGRLIFAGFLIKVHVSFANPYFVFLNTLTVHYKNWILSESARTGQPGINSRQLKEFCFSLPPTKEEQERIANALSQMDDLIAALDEQIKKKKLIKQGALQQLLTGKTRLKESSDYKMTELGMVPSDWSVKNVGELLKIGHGHDYKNLKSGNVPVYGTGGYMTSVNDFLYDGETVCIGRKGTIDKPFYHTGKIWTVDTLFYTYGFNGCIPKFIYYAFCLVDWLAMNEASGVPSLTSKNIEDVLLRVPSSEVEQAAIASTLSTMDEEIQTLQEERDKYVLVKQGMMQQLLTGKIRLN